MKTKRKSSPLRFSPVFGQKLGEDQKKGLHPDLVRFCAQTFCPTNKGEGPFRNFAYCFMLVILYWRAEGGERAWHHAPPKYASGCIRPYLIPCCMN